METENNKKSESKLSILDILGAELKDCAITAKDYMREIKEAKTETKRKYFKKKLQRHNKKAMDVVYAIEKLRLADEAKNTASVVEHTEVEVDGTDNK